MNKLFLILAALLFLFLITIGGAFWLERQSFKAINVVGEKTDFVIEKGQRTKEIGQELENAGVIGNKWAFYYYIWKNDAQVKLQAGEYELEKGMTMAQMVEKFTDGKIKSNIVKITVPEGYNNRKIIELVREKRPEIADEFVEIVNCRCLGEGNCSCDVFGDKYQFLKKIAKGVDMEGYLFPDTYFISQEETGKTLVSKFLNNFSEKVDEKMIKDIENQGKTLHEILTLASIVEREVRTDADRKIVAGLFWSRLADDHPLQSCATLAYILNQDKPQFSYEDTKIDSPYNTYQNPGIPPGPIANPGLASIRAAVYPEETDYYYFLSDPKTGKIIYSRTSEEHSENKVKYGL